MWLAQIFASGAFFVMVILLNCRINRNQRSWLGGIALAPGPIGVIRASLRSEDGVIVALGGALGACLGMTTALLIDPIKRNKNSA